MSDGERHPHFCDCDTCINGSPGMRVEGFAPLTKEARRRPQPIRRPVPSTHITALIPSEDYIAIRAEAEARGVPISDVVRDVVAAGMSARARGVAAE